MNAVEEIKRRIFLKWQYYELLDAEKNKTYAEILNLMVQEKKMKVGKDDLCKSEM